jgi:hypothetical protein
MAGTMAAVMADTEGTVADMVALMAAMDTDRSVTDTESAPLRPSPPLSPMPATDILRTDTVNYSL